MAFLMSGMAFSKSLDCPKQRSSLLKQNARMTDESSPSSLCMASASLNLATAGGHGR